MKIVSPQLVAIGALALASSCTGLTQPAQQPPPESGMSFPTPAGPDPIANEGVIEDGAVEALKEMSNFLMSAKTLEADAQGTLDVVTANGQRIQLDGNTNYKIRRPGFVINYNSDIKSRKFMYDGKNFTVYSPKLGYYATAPAPGTNREVLDTIYNKFGSRSREDLFRWGDSGANAARLQSLQSAYKVGTVTLDGVPTDHFAFREGDVDWEVWIDRGRNRCRASL